MKKNIDIDNDNISKQYANIPSWYSNKTIALYYVNNREYAVHEYELVRDIKLFYLMDKNNLHNLFVLINKKIDDLLVKLLSMEPLLYYINETQIRIDMSKLNCASKNICGKNILELITEQHWRNAFIEFVIEKFHNLNIVSDIKKLQKYFK